MGELWEEEKSCKSFHLMKEMGVPGLPKEHYGRQMFNI